MFLACYHSYAINTFYSHSMHGNFKGDVIIKLYRKNIKHLIKSIYIVTINRVYIMLTDPILSYTKNSFLIFSCSLMRSLYRSLCSLRDASLCPAPSPLLQGLLVPVDVSLLQEIKSMDQVGGAGEMFINNK